MGENMNHLDTMLAKLVGQTITAIECISLDLDDSDSRRHLIIEVSDGSVLSTSIDEIAITTSEATFEWISTELVELRRLM